MSMGLRRYTNLASTLHILRNRCLTLLSPALWDDRNDAFYMETFKRDTNALSVLALCFAESPETYHHWRVFSSGGDGICLELDKNRLIAAMEAAGGLVWKSVEYRELVDIRPVETQELPFLKRFPYEDEKEFRVLYTSNTEETETYRLPIALSCIMSISLSPWMPRPLAEAVRSTLKEIPGCSPIKMFPSTLIDNERWKEAADPKLRTERTSS